MKIGVFYDQAKVHRHVFATVKSLIDRYVN